MIVTSKTYGRYLFFIFALSFLNPGLVAGSDAPTQKWVTSGPAGGSPVQSLSVFFTVQVGSYQRLALAESDMAALQEKGCHAFHRYEDSGIKGMRYRVYVGTYLTSREANASAEKLVAEGIVESFVVKKITTKENLPEHAKGHLEEDAYLARTRRGEATASTQMTFFEPFKGPAVADASENNHWISVELDLIDAIRFSLEGNSEIRVVSFDPMQAKANMDSKQSVYDPLLFADSTFRRDPNLQSSISNIVTEDDGRSRAGFRKPLSTGGVLSTYLETRYGDLNDSEFQRTYKHVVAPTVEIKQPILKNIGSKKEKTAIQIASHEANISSAEFRKKVIEVANKVGKAYWDLLLFQQWVGINRDNFEMAEEVQRRETERYQGGLSQQLDVERARSNAQIRRSAWLRSKEEYKLAMDHLKLLLNWGELRIDSSTMIIPVQQPQTTPVKINEHEITQKALQFRPEMMKTHQDILIRKADESLAGHQRLPNLDLYGRYSVTGYGDDVDGAWSDLSVNHEDIWEVGVQFEWAIGNRMAEAKFEKKRLALLQADAHLKRVKDDIQLEVKQVLQRIATLQGEIQSNRLAMKAAQKVVEGEFVRFDIGQTSNEELLRAQDLLAVTSRSFARAITDYNVALHELARVQGVLPDGITIERSDTGT